MSTSNHKVWIVAFLILLVSLIAGTTLLVVRYAGQQPQEIIVTSPPQSPITGQIYIGGAVTSPGYYPASGPDSLKSAIENAGPTDKADLSRISIHIPECNEECTPQRIDINRAESWLLEALPGIGPGKAQAIIEYRLEHGPFSNVKELLAIEGIGASTLEEIENLITVED